MAYKFLVPLALIAWLYPACVHGERLSLDRNHQNDQQRSAAKRRSSVMVRVVPDSYCSDPKSRCVTGQPRPNRPMPIMLSSTFLKNLMQQPDGSFIVSGAINSWSAYTDLQLVLVKCYKRSGGRVLWRASEDGVTPIEAIKNATICPQPNKVSLRLRLPSWMQKGYSKSSPGFVMLAHNLPNMQYLLTGEDIVTKQPDECEATQATVFAHQYGGSSSHDTHVGVFVEWDKNCDYSTVFELAWRHGVGGYGGKSNWYSDKDQKQTWLFQTMKNSVPGMVQPWDSSKAELRAYDIPQKNLAEFKEYFHFYSSNGNHTERKPRFKNIDAPVFLHGRNYSLPVRLSFRSRRHIMRGLLNYIGASDVYSKMHRHCQTFAMDLFSFLTKQRTTLYTPVIRAFYTPHVDWFWYDPN